ncbi:MarR family winged helix-turn-helix transcriptional regulator [Desulfoluna spongiiphila]|uniref:DNA-binding transcriptional regulator, MarR family n=1 Tax=Desulfoluna spongiiphila TaxID=419481 RepID=A0A1G5HD96_9BACT|nr:MarR family transcriptional regulator [Desulfoluna spongiiphila]SCY61310.1 DNA-binding transcriptional regulator, MarR family [Desulfoluna spongiiphila]
MFNLRGFPNDQIFSRMQQDYPQLDPDAVSAFLRLLVAGSDFLGRLDALLSGHGIMHGRWLALIQLRRRTIQRALPSELAQEQGVTRATMSGLLRQLDRDGLIRRQEDPADGRKAAVILTDKGVALLDRIMPEYYTLVKELMAPLKAPEKKALAGMLDKLLMRPASPSPTDPAT